MNSTIEHQLNAVRQRIAQAAAQCGRDPHAITLLAVSKTKPIADIDAAMSGNVCRCATYVRIRAAIHEAAKSLA